jgi:hypothetical protein
MDSSNGDYGFSWLLAKRLEHLDAIGLAPEAIQGLRNRGQEVARALLAFRTQAESLRSSGKFTPSGLQQELLTLGATAAGQITRSLDVTHLLNHLRQHQERLRATGRPDGEAGIIRFLQQQEIRAFLVAQGVSKADPLVSNQVYRQAVSAGDVLTQEAMESWPLGLNLDAELVAEGQSQRQQAADPITAAKVREAESLLRAYQQSLKDALQELPPAEADDPIARQAAGSESHQAQNQ